MSCGWHDEIMRPVPEPLKGPPEMRCEHGRIAML
jgi:hypothetical protein